MPSEREQGPLILGASGRLGQAFRRLWDGGHWPSDSEPVWQQRSKDASGSAIVWDLLNDRAPSNNQLARAKGVIVLAGVTSGPPEVLALNTALARAGIDLSRHLGLGPVLICSSAAVYGRAAGPQAETARCQPANPYGVAKLAMEQAIAGHGATCLRIANVAGSDQLFGAAARGKVQLDQFADGTGPERAYIGPQSLAATMLRLIDLGQRGRSLPDILNIAAPLPVAMQSLLKAAGVEFDWTPAPPAALASVTLDTGRMAALAPLPPDAATPATLVAEARAAGWKAA